MNIEVYGRFGAIETNGTVMLTNEFRISTTAFPMVFAGTRGQAETNYLQAGYYDPVYAPRDLDLTWCYPEWDGLTFSTYERHVGEYNGAAADGNSVYFSWTDYRLLAVSSLVPREQSDVRFIRLPWP
jgi:hypothetical protein